MEKLIHLKNDLGINKVAIWKSYDADGSHLRDVEYNERGAVASRGALPATDLCMRSFAARKARQCERAQQPPNSPGALHRNLCSSMHGLSYHSPVFDWTQFSAVPPSGWPVEKR